MQDSGRSPLLQEKAYPPAQSLLCPFTLIQAYIFSNDKNPMSVAESILVLL